MSHRYVIAVSGVPGAGKTSLLQEIARQFADSAVVEHEPANGQGVDPAALIRHVQELKSADGPPRYALIETTHPEALRACVDLSIGIDTPLDIAFARRLLRDKQARKVESIRRYVAEEAGQIRRMQEAVRQADLLLDGTQPIEALSRQAIDTIRARFEPPLTFKRATPGDLDEVYSIIREAAQWLMSRGIMQWEWFLSDAGRRHVARRLDSAEVYLAYMGGEAVGTITIQWDDAEFWGEAGLDARAGYVQGMAVRRSVAGRGMGQQLLAFAEQRTLDQGRRFLRLDCLAENAGLCGYFARLGFADRGPAELFEGRWKARLFEREIDANAATGDSLRLIAA